MTTKKRVLKTLVISMAAAMSAPTWAEEGKTLPRIDVVGQGEQAISKQPGSVVIITEQELDLAQPLSTEDALRKVPGINIKGEEETAVVVNIGMRGLPADSSKTLILEDGVPVAPSLFLSNGRYYNPRIQRMESIEVLKGAASLRYGPSTIGGVINYITKMPDDGVSVSGRVGSFGLREGTVELGASNPSGDAAFGVVYTKAQSDGFQNKGYKMDDIMVKGALAIGDNQMVSMKFSHTNNDANISYRGLFIDDYKAGKTYNPAPDDWFLTERNAFDINHEWDINDKMKLNTLVYWSHVTRDYWRFGVTTPNSASPTSGRWSYTDTVQGNNRAFERKGVESRLSINHGLFGINNDAEVGVRYMTEEMDDKKISATRTSPRSGTLSAQKTDTANSLAVYAQNRFEINDRLAITPGLRVEHYEQSSVDERNRTKQAKTSNTEFMPGVGVTYQLAAMAQLYGGVYKAFSPAQSADALNGYTDQRLEAERSVNMEIGVRGGNQRFNYEVTAFQMDFDNQIVSGNSDPNLSKQNAGKTLHQGVELSAGYKLGGGFDISGNMTYIPTSEYRSGVDKGNRIVYSPEMLANLALGYTHGGLRTQLSAHYNGSQYASSDNRKAISGNNGGVGAIWGGKLDAYTTVDFDVYYSLNKQLSLFGAVKNLTDERYIAGLRQGIYAGPSRSFEMGAKYKF